MGDEKKKLQGDLVKRQQFFLRLPEQLGSAPSIALLMGVLKRRGSLTLQVINPPPLADIEQACSIKMDAKKPSLGEIGLIKISDKTYTLARRVPEGACWDHGPWKRKEPLKWLGRIVEVQESPQTPWCTPAPFPFGRSLKARWQTYIWSELRVPTKGVLNQARESSPWGSQTLLDIYRTKAANLTRQENNFASRLEPGSRILIPGCASGRQVFALRQKGFRALGLDLEQDMLKMAQKSQPGAWLRGDVCQLPVRGRSQSGVILGLFLWSLLPGSAIPSMLTELNRILEPGGLLLFDYRIIENTNRLFRLVLGAMVSQRLGIPRPWNQRPAYYLLDDGRIQLIDHSFYYPVNARRLLRRGGFDILEQSGRYILARKLSHQ